MKKRQISKSFIVSTVGGITLLALAIAVFSVAVKARSVSAGAEATVELVESLRVVSLSRSELSTASRLDDQPAIEAAIANAVDAITSARTALADSSSPELLANFDAYERAATAQGELLLDPDHIDNAALIAEARTGSSFDQLATSLRIEQEEALRQLGADNEFMNTIGTIATFIVAFVVPSAALYIFEALRRAPRRTRELEMRSSRLEARSASIVMAMQQEVATLRMHLFGAGDATTAQRHDNVRRSLLRLDNLALVNGAMHHWHRDEVDLVAIADEVRSSLNSNEEVTLIADKSVRHAVGDSMQIALIVHELVTNGLNHGVRPVSIEVRDGDALRVSVIDHGVGLTPVVEAAVLLERDYALRNNLANGRFGYGLLAARLAAQSMGAKLSYEHVDRRTIMTLEIPASERAVAPSIAESTLVEELPEAA